MTFLPVPWAVEGGAENATETARILAYAATQSASGVVGILDMKVTQMSTPGAGVAVGTGACVAACATPGYDYQSYVASRVSADDYLDVPPNGGASTRYDLVVVRIENAWIDSAVDAPDNVQQGPYVQLRLFDNVGATVAGDRSAARAYLKSRGITGVPLAGIALPAGANSVVNGYLTDLRAVANPRRYRPPIFTLNPPARVNVPGSWGPWLSSLAWRVEIPDWATRVTFSLTVYGAKCDRQSSSTNGNTYGQIRISLGSLLTQATYYDMDAPANSGSTRTTLGLGDTVTVPAEMRGTTQTFTVQGDQVSGNQPLYVDDRSSVTLDVDFAEVVV